MTDEKRETYISVDIEASGPIPGEYSMIALGACRVDDPTRTFYAELKPLSDKAIPEALAVSKLDLATLKVNGEEPAKTMIRFDSWISEVTSGTQAVFVGFNATFDWAFVNWYFIKYAGKNSFGIGGIDIKAFYMGFAGVTWDKTRSSQLPAEFHTESEDKHNALADAISQASTFQKILNASRARFK
jgi:DNA polymerase III epsilon subunit-like protein